VHLSKYHITGASSRELIKKCFFRGPQQPTAEGRGSPGAGRGEFSAGKGEGVNMP